VLKNLVLVRKRRMSAFRKIALGTWSTVGDPSVYGTIELRMDRALEYLALLNAKTGRRATVTHLVAKAAAAAPGRARGECDSPVQSPLPASGRLLSGGDDRRTTGFGRPRGS
jgi:hypothetical protein